jgi:hypothetical protein
MSTLITEAVGSFETSTTDKLHSVSAQKQAIKVQRGSLKSVTETTFLNTIWTSFVFKALTQDAPATLFWPFYGAVGC